MGAGTVGVARPEVVGEVPALQRYLDTVALIDTLQADLVAQAAALDATGEVEAATGLPVTMWLAQVGRRPRGDRRMLDTAATRLPLLPATPGRSRRGQGPGP